MSVDPRLLDQVLSTPETRDVVASPIVTAVILSDPANAADLAPALRDAGSNRAKNARRILCQFGADAVPFLLGVLAGGSADAHKDAIEIMWAMLIGEDKATIRDTLGQSSNALDLLLHDKRPIPDRMPAYIERDFVGRICDLTYGVLCYLGDPEYDRSLFRSMDDDARDAEIRRYRGRVVNLS